MAYIKQPFFIFLVLVLFFFLSLAKASHADAAPYIGAVEVIKSDTEGTSATGRVFHDKNKNSKLDEGEPGIAGVMVSNGRDVVVTDEEGDYKLPAYSDMNLFITKPAGYDVPVNQDMIPQFHYIHKVDGSPELRYGGISPTGPLPVAINFPLVKNSIGEKFQCLAFGDVQAYSNREYGYVRDTLGQLLATRNNENTKCLIFLGDVAGDDLSLYPRLKQIIALGGVPYYWVGGNHDIDFDAPSDQHSFDTFRREFGPEYYSFDIGNVHFVVLDNVRYPCNGVDDHAFCAPDKKKTYNGMISGRQLEWLKNDLAYVPKDKLIVVAGHIPFVSFTDNASAKNQVDNLDDLYKIIGDRPTLGLAGHSHTTENILPGEHYKGWQEHTKTGPAKFHFIITGAVSGSWWTGDFNDDGIPHATQRLGSPRGYYQFDFDGSTYKDAYLTFDKGAQNHMHASFNTPRFRKWATQLLNYVDLYGAPSEITPPVTRHDLGDMNLITRADLKDGTWVAVNVWNGSKDTKVSVSINGQAATEAKRTQEGEGEAKRSGVEYTDPLALVKQSTNGRNAFKSVRRGKSREGYRTWQGHKWSGVAGPFRKFMLTINSSHLWRANLPADLPNGVHRLDITATDHHGRTFQNTITFEVVDELPEMNWQPKLWQKK